MIGRYLPPACRRTGRGRAVVPRRGIATLDRPRHAICLGRAGGRTCACGGTQMSVRQLMTGALLAVLCSMLIGGTAAARSDRQSSPVMWHPQTGLSGQVGTSTATIVRRDDGLSLRFSTSGLRPGHAYTLWFVAINNPDACAATPCSGPDILQNAATDSQVTYATGHVVAGSGRATFAASFRAGAIDGWLPDFELADPRSAEIQLVLNDHGPLLDGYL